MAGADTTLNKAPVLTVGAGVFGLQRIFAVAVFFKELRAFCNKLIALCFKLVYFCVGVALVEKYPGNFKTNARKLFLN